MQRLFNGLSADRRLILKIAMHPIFYKRIWVMFLLKKGLAFLHRRIDDYGWKSILEFIIKSIAVSFEVSPF
jgi:hypothetical protein